jgi:hypothetical protein
MSAEDNLSRQFGDKKKWIPTPIPGWKIKDHMLSYHFRQSDVPRPSKYNDKAWKTIHDNLHAEGKLSEPHDHWTPKNK